jgi:hypothetical protein
MKTAALLVVALLLPAVVPADETVARATDLELSRAELGEWLVNRHGVPHVKSFLLETLVEREARQRGLHPSDAEVTAAWEAERLRVVEMLHRGKEERFLNDLAGRGYSIETWAARRQDEITAEMCLVRLAQADRVITDEALQKRFRAIYSEAGEHTTLEVMFFSAYRNVGSAETRPDITKLKQEARDRAQAAAEAWRSGSGLADLVAESDPIQSEFVQDGRINSYRRDLLGTAVDRAVNSLDRAGDVSPPIDVFDGSYVLRLVERRDVSFDSVREELTASLAAEPANSAEREVLREALFERYQGEVLLR